MRPGRGCKLLLTYSTLQVLEPVQQAKLMVAAYPLALDLLAICSTIKGSGNNFGATGNSLALLSQLPPDSPFQALGPHAKC